MLAPQQCISNCSAPQDHLEHLLFRFLPLALETLIQQVSSEAQESVLPVSFQWVSLLVETSRGCTRSSKHIEVRGFQTPSIKASLICSLYLS